MSSYIYIYITNQIAIAIQVNNQGVVGTLTGITSSGLAVHVATWSCWAGRGMVVESLGWDGHHDVWACLTWGMTYDIIWPISSHIHNIHMLKTDWTLGNEPLIQTDYTDKRCWLFQVRLPSFSGASAAEFHCRTAFITLNLASDYFWSRGNDEARNSVSYCTMMINYERMSENVRILSELLGLSEKDGHPMVCHGLSSFFSACKMRYPSFGQNHFEHIQFQWSFHGKSRTKKEHPHVSRSRPGFVSQCFPYRGRVINRLIESAIAIIRIPWDYNEHP